MIGEKLGLGLERIWLEVKGDVLQILTEDKKKITELL